MTALALSFAQAAPVLAIVDGHATTTSMDVARHFGRDHKSVLRAVENLLSQMPEGYERNFAPIQIDTDLGMGRVRQDPAYRLTRDGFTLLAMGFTGKKALAFKLAYIDAFNQMEAALAGQQHSPERINSAHAQAAQMAAVVQRAVFDALLADRRDWQHARWLFDLSPAGEPRINPVGPTQFVISMAELPSYILDAGTLLSNAELATLNQACADRMARRLAH